MVIDAQAVHWKTLRGTIREKPGCDRTLELPPYTLASDGTINLYYGEIFCRVEDCSKARYGYSATNNLILHIKTHEDVQVKENKGGRVAQKARDEAVQWYKEVVLGAGKEQKDKGENQESQGGDGQEEVEEEEGTVEEKPALPRKKDGTVHITKMRRQVTIMGHDIPCSTCSNRNDCCKDKGVCQFFNLFDEE